MRRTPLWAPSAWVAGAWQDRVLLEIGADRCFGAISVGVDCPSTARILPGPVLPGMVNAHSHAFQRGFAGRTEQRKAREDDFWSWRERMYLLANGVTPASLRILATQLYAELLEGGYTQVCEFHYLHRSLNGDGASFGLSMSEALIEAAGDAGIGLTLLPALYERADFQGSALSPLQQGFAGSPPAILALRDAIRAMRVPQLNTGIAIHSLRAVSPSSIKAVCRALHDDPGPIHLHIAEQTAEVRNCLATTGLRPVAWLARHVLPDSRWHLVHATHTEPEEVRAIAQAGASVVVCPTTEANLGDGIVDWPAWRAAGVGLALGSDSQVGRCWPAELRLLEYSQRLRLQRRNLGAAPARGSASTATALFEDALCAGARAAGFTHWGIREGARADLVVLDTREPGLLGIPAVHQLDAVVFACDRLPFREVWVAGTCQVEEGRHRKSQAFAAAFLEQAAQLHPEQEWSAALD